MLVSKWFHVVNKLCNKLDVYVAANEKQKALEAVLSNIEMKLQAHKTSLSEEISEFQSAKEDVKNTMSQLTNIQGRIRDLNKEAEEMKTITSSSNKENISEKYNTFLSQCVFFLKPYIPMFRSRVDLYRQLTAVTFAGRNPNCPHELKGFVACAGPNSNLKTFAFNTAEHSSSLMSGYIWNVLEGIHKKNWEDLNK